MTNDTLTVTELRCESCHEPHGGKVGDPCDEACQHSRLVLAIERGRYTVEIGADHGAPGCFKASGFVGDMLSREFGVKDYRSLKNAELVAKRWLEAKCSGA
jgi:hypothetical protein